MNGLSNLNQLTKLPSDCWICVLDCLSVVELRQIALVSRGLSITVEPMLYRTISWNWDPVPIRPLLQLLQSILRHPRRAFHVQHVRLMSNTLLDSATPWTAPSLNLNCIEEIANFPFVLQRTQAIIQEASFPDQHRWSQALQEGNPYALVAILLSQLHKLRSLHLDYSFVWLYGFPGLMLRHALFSAPQDSLSKFQSLTTVDYGGNVRRAPRESLSTVGIPKDYPACNPYQFGAWFHLPSLRSLAIWLKTQQEFLIPGVLSNITQLNTLIIARSTIQEDQVPSLLSETGSLRTLHLGMAYKCGHHIALTNGPAILQGLISVKHTLTKLSIGLEYYPPPFGDRFREIGEEELRKPFHRFLKHFPRLTSVEVPVELLIGWDPEPSVDLTMVLPSTLEQLCIREELVYLTPRDWRDYWTEKSLEDCLLENASRLQSHMPDLRQIRLRSWAPTERGNVRRVKQRLIVYTKFKQLGIQFDLVFDHMSTGLWI
ncbi:uncharacterized protein ATNIH1004_009455 [Aspergillus tanneri]|uniref:F-box domain-containing protein n=1 Tax=Aspergillus tanneri TaxID=1220188 RepID=A0A5M9MCM5_9EURO|nr:uncharacterized protein ATNIH1004_009455 [Aspergillus tanneri]KAA8642703.1 hypothetical protein ATNIH1004_009455 [Aspergillus tanneri]